MLDINHYQTLLTDRLAELDARMHRLEDSLDRPHSRDWADDAAERQGNEVREGLGRSDLTEARGVRAALDRIAEGEFGYCTSCGAEISAERLEIVPHATLCRACAAKAAQLVL